MNRVNFNGDYESYEIQYKLQIFDPDELLHFVLIPDDLIPFKGQGFIPIVKDTIANIRSSKHNKNRISSKQMATFFNY